MLLNDGNEGGNWDNSWADENIGLTVLVGIDRLVGKIFKELSIGVSDGDWDALLLKLGLESAEPERLLEDNLLRLENGLNNSDDGLNTDYRLDNADGFNDGHRLDDRDNLNWGGFRVGVVFLRRSGLRIVSVLLGIRFRGSRLVSCLVSRAIVGHAVLVIINARIFKVQSTLLGRRTKYNRSRSHTARLEAQLFTRNVVYQKN